MKRKFWHTLWATTFVIGSFLSLLYVLGWRVNPNTGEIIPTGVLDISVYPNEGAVLFLDGKIKGKVPQIFRGFPLGQVEVRIEKSNYIPFQKNIIVEKDLVTKVRNYYLIPKEPSQRMHILGNEEVLYWDLEKRGYIERIPEKKAIKIVDFIREKEEIIELTFDPTIITFTPKGEAILFSATQKIQKDFFSERIFSSYENMIAESFFSPLKESLVFFRGKSVFLKNIETGDIKEITKGEDQVLGTWWMKDSDDILVLTKKKIFFWNTFWKEERVFLDVENVETGFFLPSQKTLFYKEEKTWKSIIF